MGLILIQRKRMIKGKNVLLAVTGSIAAYKSTYIVRGLKKLGASVRVIQTESSLEFVSSMVLSTLSENQVCIDLIDKETREWNNHVDISLWADLMIVAPATAKTISKMVEGNCDNLLLATYLSSKCPVYIAPAMDRDMYQHPSTKENIRKLKSYGHHIIPSPHGELASGLIGEGRMSEPEDILNYIIDDINKEKELYGKKCLVTAGPTHESIDPVRFISNYSSGKMGVFIAEELAEKGAFVDLILGPSNITTNYPNINKIDVVTADQMHKAVLDIFKDHDISVFSAAVSDYKVKNVSDQKIKKSKKELELTLSKNKDILLEISRKKSSSQIIVGFALETNNELDNAIKKLKDKNLDFIILNSLNDEGAAFNHDTNKITIIDKDLKIQNFDLKDKKDVAVDIVLEIIKKNKLL